MHTLITFGISSQYCCYWCSALVTSLPVKRTPYLLRTMCGSFSKKKKQNLFYSLVSKQLSGVKNPAIDTRPIQIYRFKFNGIYTYLKYIVCIKTVYENSYKFKGNEFNSWPSFLDFPDICPTLFAQPVGLQRTETFPNPGHVHFPTVVIHQPSAAAWLANELAD